jgi:hypothetical protein
MGQAADSFWLDILVGFRFSAGFLSVDRPVVVRREEGGVVFVLLTWCLPAKGKKNGLSSGPRLQRKVGRPIRKLIGHLIDAVPARVLR